MAKSTPLGRVRGLGSAHAGVHHWWHQKLTAGSNILLMSWLVLSIARRPAFDYATLHAWMQGAWVAVPMALLVASVFFHARLGLQVVIEDYAKAQNRIVLSVLASLFFAGSAGIALFSIAKIAFGAAH